MNFKPMLASPADFSILQYPLFASPKLDGIRASVVGGKLLSRTLKEIPNRHIFELLSQSRFDGLDGELIVGRPTDPDVYRNTTSAVMRRDGCPEFTYHVFDLYDTIGTFSTRLTELRALVSEWRESRGFENLKIVVPEHVHINDEAALLEYEAAQIALGYEGLILRSGTGTYKHGRSTAREQFMLKVKRFEDSEAEVVGVVEEMHNGNEATTNELGRTKRSSAKAGKTGKGTMGTLVCRDLKTGVEFEIGTGFTAADRAKYFNEPPLGKLAKYKHFPIGAKDKPRQPVFLGWRDPGDL